MFNPLKDYARSKLSLVICKIPFIRNSHQFVNMTFRSRSPVKSNFVTFHYNFPIKTMASIKLKINDKNYTVDADPKCHCFGRFATLSGLPVQNTDVVWHSAAHVPCIWNGKPVRSCTIPVSAAGK